MSEDLILKYLTNQIDTAQKRELLHWIKKSRENARYFAEIKNIWIASSLNNPINNLDLNKEFEAISNRLDRKSNRIKLIDFINKFFRIAAILLLAYGIGFTWYYFKENSKSTFNEITTQRGEKSLVKLSDGTKIWLNSETVLRYPANLNSRKVEVTLDGEAYFDVSKAKNRTFVVKASSLDISVLGTRFNVKSYNKENIVETTLEEGRISITGEVGKMKIKKPVILLPNQQATFVNKISDISIKKINNEVGSKTTVKEPEIKETKIPVTKPKLTVNEKVDAEIYTSWKDGKLIFKSERFEELSLRLERWHDVKIEIKSKALIDKTYTGVFEKETIEQALRALSMSYPFRFEIDQNKITITEN